MDALTLNPFASNAYSMAALTESMLRLPYNMYGRVGQLGLFTEQGISTATALIEEMGGVLNLVVSSPRGGPSNVNSVGKRKMRPFSTSHFAVDDVVLPDEVIGVRAFGSTMAMNTVANLMNQKLQSLKNKHDITLEWLRVGALKGVLLDGDGVTVLYNWFNEFQITPYVANFQFSNAAFNVLSTCNNISRHMEDNLHGEIMSEVHALVSPQFLDALVGHPQVQVAFQFFKTNQPLGYDYRKGFTFGGIVFEEYRGTATDATGTAHPFIVPNTAQFFPLGTTSTFRTYFAPADFNETVNTMGLPYYAKQEPRKFGRGTDLHTQQNPLPICLRPELLVQGTMS